MFGALKRGRFRNLASLILVVVNVVGELQRKRTLAASRGFLAAARFSCIYLVLVTCARLSWLIVSFSVHVKLPLSYLNYRNLILMESEVICRWPYHFVWKKPSRVWQHCQMFVNRLIQLLGHSTVWVKKSPPRGPDIFHFFTNRNF